jgi:hypothetical membrane protein
MLKYEGLFWREKVFIYISIGGVLYIFLTIGAMFFYPGGTVTNTTTQGYSFFRNFFSDLGRLHTSSGAPNFISAALFFPAQTLAGLSLLTFSLAFPQFFRHAREGRTSCMVGSILGALAGIYFMGVAFTPAELLFRAHVHFALWGFRMFSVAALFWAIAIFRHGTYLKRYAWIFVGFGVLLIGFILLTMYGPSAYETVQGTIIQATGQKIICYASLASIIIQAQGARARNKRSIPAQELGMQRLSS